MLTMGLISASLADDAKDKDKGDDALRKSALELNTVTGDEPIAKKLKALLTDRPAAKKLVALAKTMSKETPQPFNRNATFLLGVLAESLEEVETSAAFYRLNAQQSLKLHSERGVAEAYSRLIMLYYSNKRFAEAEKVCKEFLALEGEENDALENLKPGIMRQMVLSIAKQGAGDRAIKLIDDLIKADPRNWLHRALKAQVYAEMDKHDDAAKMYLDVIERIKKDGRIEKEDQKDFVERYRHQLSGVYIDQGNIEKASEQLKILLEADPDNPTYNNDLGYIWADKGMNLADAEKMIRKAIEEERKLKKKLNIEGDEDNAAYLDSLGWVLFKQGKHKEAKTPLLAAVKQKEGLHLEILDHLGDVHMALGEKAEAIAAWKKGIEHATKSKRDQKRKVEVEKKLKMQEEK
jgi:tetratricopeptide (TPR) repeat protein